MVDGTAADAEPEFLRSLLDGEDAEDEADVLQAIERLSRALCEAGGEDRGEAASRSRRIAGALRQLAAMIPEDAADQNAE
jgi:hypothetical protein